MKNSIFKAVFFLCLASLLPANLLLAQLDSAIVLPEATVKAPSVRSSPLGLRAEQWDSTRLASYRSQSVAGLLGRESAVFLKTYGLGSLATSSVRGGAAGHTAILWNGFSIQSPMLGLTDLSLLPAIFADDVGLQYGGNSALWGSGAIGGTVSLSNHSGFDQNMTLEAGAEVGSFGWQGQHLQAGFGLGKFGGKTRIFRQQAENDFPFKINGGLDKKKQANAALRQHGLLQEFFWRPNPSQEWSAKIWWQSAFREIPPVTTQSRSEASQADEILRSTLHWKLSGRRNVLQARVGFFREKIDYRDDLTGLRAISHFENWIGEVENQWDLGPMHQLHAGFNQTFSRAFADDFGQPPAQNQSAIFAAYRFDLPRFQFQVSARQALADGKIVPFVPSLGMELSPQKWLKVKAQVSRNFRLPTLNDQHWQPGGNPGLRPEIGWAQEAGAHFLFKKNNHEFRYGLTAFNRNIGDWILWSQRQGDVFWSANNLAKVWSRGVEQRATWDLRADLFAVTLRLGYDFVRSTNEKASEKPNIQKGAQLIYVPENQAFGQFEFRSGGWMAAYQHRYTGSVATLGEPLPGYQTGHFQVGRDFRWRNLAANLLFQIENIWDESYRVIERRPMPGRHFRAGLNCKFLKSNKK